MSPGEAVRLLVNLLVLAVTFTSQLGRRRSTRFLAPTAIAQALAEDPRRQLVPAYTLTAALLAARLPGVLDRGTTRQPVVNRATQSRHDTRSASDGRRTGSAVGGFDKCRRLRRSGGRPCSRPSSAISRACRAVRSATEEAGLR